MKTNVLNSIFLKMFLVTFGISAGPFFLLGIYQLCMFHKVVYGTNNPLAMLVGLSILFSIAAAGFITTYVTTPIKTLLQNIKNYREHKKKTEFIYDERQDEFGYLFAEYKKMIDEIDSYQDELMKNAHLTAIGSTIAVVSHELRTPLSIIMNRAAGIKQYLPELIEAYTQVQKTYGLAQNIREDHLKILSKGLNSIEEETKLLFKVVDMLLVNVSRERIQSSAFEVCSISSCVNSALTRYPFQGNKRECIHWEASGEQGEFLFNGIEILVVHVLFNLIKNALYHIEAVGKGEITISLANNVDVDRAYNILIFKDTGKGISPEILPNIFIHFFSKTQHGIGIGLAYCKMVMEAIGGGIVCESEEGEYTKFILSFPKIVT